MVCPLSFETRCVISVVYHSYMQHYPDIGYILIYSLKLIKATQHCILPVVKQCHLYCDASFIWNLVNKLSMIVNTDLFMWCIIHMKSCKQFVNDSKHWLVHYFCEYIMSKVYQRCVSKEYLLGNVYHNYVRYIVIDATYSINRVLIKLCAVNIPTYDMLFMIGLSFNSQLYWRSYSIKIVLYQVKHEVYNKYYHAYCVYLIKRCNIYYLSVKINAATIQVWPLLYSKTMFIPIILKYVVTLIKCIAIIQSAASNQVNTVFTMFLSFPCSEMF